MGLSIKQLTFLEAFGMFIAPRLDLAPHDPATPELLREAATLHELYLSNGEGAFKARTRELLKDNEPRGMKVIELSAGLALIAGLIGDDLKEAAGHARAIADELEVYFPGEE